MTKTIKTLSVAVLAGGMATCVYSQGNLTFSTYYYGGATGLVFQHNSTTAVPNGTYGQLFESPTGTAGSALTPLGTPQQFSGGYINGPTLTVTGAAANTSVFYELIVWNSAAGNVASTALGANYIGADGGTVTPGTGLTFFGESGLNSIVLGGTVGKTVFLPNSTSTFANFAVSLVPVPEPSTIVLGGLGAAALLAFRRRK